MKRLIIILFLAIYLQADDNKLAMVSEYMNMFSKIGEKRVGVDPRVIDSVKAPFVITENNVTKSVDGKSVVSKPEFVLQAIINKRAKISGNWYGLGDEVSTMKIKYIKNGVVWLQNSEYKKRLTIRKENAKISIK